TVVSSGSQTYEAGLSAAGAVALTGLDVTVTDALTADSLLINGKATLQSVSLATVTTTGSQTYNGPVVLATDALPNSGSDPYADIAFLSAVDSAATGTYSLTVNCAGATVFDGAVGGSAKLGRLLTDAAGATFLNGPATTGANTIALTD